METNEEIKKSSYYTDNLPKVIERLKNYVEKTLDIIDKDIDDELSDDKYLNVLKARRQASEDAVWALKRIDELENELNGVSNDDSATTISTTNLAKQRAQRKANNAR